jgi:hypothetical protein
VMEERIKVGNPVVIQRNGEPVGIAALSPDASDALDALRAAGYDVQEASVADDGTVDLTQECEIDNPRPCELTIALGRIQELGQEAGVETTEIEAIEERGTVTEEEAKAASRAVIDRMPDGDVRQEAETWFLVAFEEPTDDA